MKRITVKDLTIEEKLRLICGDGSWHLCDLEGKLPKIRVTDASMGVRFTESNGIDKKSVAYPSLQMLANTWNTEIVCEYAECVADDCLDAGADVLLGPGVNVKRNPLCGRNFEYFSEDPLLSGIMAREYVSAMQQEGIAACVKHFCCNNLEYNRMLQSSVLDERTLREIYLKAFEIAVQAKPFSVMCSYNKINGIQGSENEAGFKILREEFGFDGLIISDWESVYDRAKSAKSGLDLEMPFSQKNYEKLLSDYAEGKITDEEIDKNAERVLDFIYKVKRLQSGKTPKHTTEQRIEFTRKAEEEGIVLLKNNGVLPLKPNVSVALCGQYARPQGNIKICGGGSGQVPRITDDYDIPKLFENKHNGKVVYESAFSDRYIPNGFNPGAAMDNAEQCEVNIVFAGTGAAIECEGSDRSFMELPPVQERTIIDTARINKNTVVVLFAGAPIDMSAWIDDVAAVVYVGFAGERGDEAIVNVLCGKVNPSGKLSETFPVHYADTPAAKSYMDGKVTVYEEGIFAGYRYYEKYNVPVLFPFGHGLSYSVFRYKNLSLTTDGSNVKVCFEIQNESNIDGKEVAQIYVNKEDSAVSRPVKELKAFAKPNIPAGKAVKVEVDINANDLTYWSEKTRKPEIENGLYEIIVGSSSSDVKLIGKISVNKGELFVI